MRSLHLEFLFYLLNAVSLAFPYLLRIFCDLFFLFFVEGNLFANLRLFWCVGDQLALRHRFFNFSKFIEVYIFVWELILFARMLFRLLLDLLGLLNLFDKIGERRHVY